MMYLHRLVGELCIIIRTTLCRFSVQNQSPTPILVLDDLCCICSVFNIHRLYHYSIPHGLQSLLNQKVQL